ncbi:MAG: hypothetical protein ACE5GK_07900 [Nitrospiria bacterium]
MLAKITDDFGPAFCDAVKEILESGKKRFKSIRGKLDLVSEEHFGKRVPQGFEICFGWRNGKAYHCRTSEGLSKEETADLYVHVNHSLQRCLQTEWQSKEKNVDRVNARRFMTYHSASHPITIRIGERNIRSGWIVDIYFKK